MKEQEACSVAAALSQKTGRLARVFGPHVGGRRIEVARFSESGDEI